MRRVRLGPSRPALRAQKMGIHWTESLVALGEGWGEVMGWDEAGCGACRLSEDPWKHMWGSACCCKLRVWVASLIAYGNTFLLSIIL